MSITENYDNPDTGKYDAIPYYPEESYFYILPEGISTGIDEINADVNAGEVIYNLQGIQVYRPLAPGMYIINGKKTAVK